MEPVSAADVGRRDARWTIWIACVGAAITTAGIQGLAPALPAIQEQFGLSAAQLSWVTSIYLFPSMFSALAGGMLADRIGMRAVFAGALAVFGLGGIVLMLQHTLTALLVTRFVQGMAFGVAMSLSVGVIGMVAPSGAAAARAQSRRIISLATAEAAFPMIGGVLLLVSWYAPFALQILTLPVAVVAWLRLPSGARPAGSKAVPAQKGAIRAVLAAPAVAAVQALGGLRFIFKFAVLTYFPVLAVNELGMAPEVVGIVMGLSAVLTALTAVLTERLVARWTPARLLGGCLALTGVALVGMGLSPNLVLLTAALWLFGLQDGVFGVGHNVMVTEKAPPGAQSTYVGLTGTVRNVGKFAAPLVLGAATIVLSLPVSFVVLGAGSLLTVLVARRAEG